MAGESVEVLLAQIDGKIDTLSVKIDAKIEEIGVRIEAGDRESQQLFRLQEGEIAHLREKVNLLATTLEDVAKNRLPNIVKELEERSEEMEGRNDVRCKEIEINLTSRYDERIGKNTGRLDNLEQRMQKQELNWAKLSGVAAFAALGGGGVATAIIKVIGG